MLRHCTLPELLDIRDGHGSAAARTHVEQCRECGAELERVHQRRAALKALPSLSPPRDRWAAVREELGASRRRVRWMRAGWAGLAAAAGLVLVVGLRGGAQPEQAAQAPEIESLVQESQRLENMLRAVGRERRIMNGMTAAVVADLEDRIAVVDAGLEDARMVTVSDDQVRDLWRQRVTLMDALVSVHVRPASLVGF